LIFDMQFLLARLEAPGADNRGLPTSLLEPGELQ
jgi:hypothetical protein